MRVLFFCNLVPEKLGAYEAFLAELTRAFAAAGDELTLVFGGEPDPGMAALLRNEGLSWHVLPGWTDDAGREHAWAFPRGALRLLRGTRPDLAVVNYGNELPTLAVALLGPLAGVGRMRWIWQQHQQVRAPSLLTRHLSALRLLSVGVDHFITVYDGGRESLLQRGLPARRVSTIYNGIRDHRPTRPAGWLRQELGVDADVLLLLTTGWLIPRKRIDFILRALAGALPAVTGRVVMLVVGDGPERASLVALTRELGISEVVSFLGLRNDVRELLHEVDLLVHASRAETCTYAITEAMASGRPALVTEAGAAREQIVSGETGVVVGPDDMQGFVAALVTLLNDGMARERQGCAARNRWGQSYRLDVTARDYHHLCRQVVGGAA